MPRNGSGLYSLPEAAFVPGAVISSAAVNSDFSDIASALTTSLATDGQSVMTGQLKLSTGIVSAPALTWSSDLDTGWYLIGAGNPGLACNGANVLNISGSGLVLTGDFSVSGNVTFAGSVAVTGAVTLAGQTLAEDGTVALPAYSFTNDPNTGFYRIGADEIGVACNGAKVLDISPTGLVVTGAISATNISITAPTVQRFTSGSGTYTKPATCRYIRVTMVAGGGGGAAFNTNNGGDGGDSTFESWTTFHGQGGVISGSGSAGGGGGTGGAAGSGTLLLRVAGTAGGRGSINGGIGGPSSLGGAGAAGQSNGVPGNAASSNSGSGGSGGNNAASYSGGGGGGEYVQFLITSPSATYSYAVGAAGTGGAAGVQGGGQGGAGIIIVEEFYA